jgi:hypothetical protein
VNGKTILCFSINLRAMRSLASSHFHEREGLQLIKYQNENIIFIIE